MYDDESEKAPIEVTYQFPPTPNAFECIEQVWLLPALLQVLNSD
jgi:hypothetical protein